MATAATAAVFMSRDLLVYSSTSSEIVIHFHYASENAQPSPRARAASASSKNAPKPAVGSSLFAEESGALTLPGPRLFGFAFVMQLFTTRNRQFDLRPPLGIKIELEGHQCHAFPFD